MRNLSNNMVGFKISFEESVFSLNKLIAMIGRGF